MGKVIIAGSGGGADTSIVTANVGDVLKDKIIVDKEGNLQIGTMPNNGAVSPSALGAGDSYTIPAGYHNGSGKVTVQSLATLTASGDATAAQILKDKKAYVDGTLVTGTMPNNGAVAPSALGAGGSYTIPAGYHNGSGKVTVQSLATLTASGDATAAQILTGKKAYVDGSLITGTMANQGAKTSSLNCGGSYTIPAGYHNGRGKITANSLSSQTSATATAATIRSGYTAWVNGSKLTGTLAVKSAISFKAAALSATSIRISWTNPSKGPWEGVFIQMSTSGNPGVSGGTRKYTGKGNTATAGASNYVDITGLSVGTTYYFTCTSYATGLGNGSSYNVNATTKGFVIYDYGKAVGTIEDGTIYDKLTINSNNLHIVTHSHDCSGYSQKRTMGAYNVLFDVKGKSTLNSLDSYSNVVIETKPIAYAYRAKKVANYSLAFKWTYWYEDDDEAGYEWTYWKVSTSGNALSLGSIQTLKIPIPASEKYGHDKADYKNLFSKYGYPEKITVGGNYHCYVDQDYAWGEYYIYRVYLE